MVKQKKQEVSKENIINYLNELTKLGVVQLHKDKTISLTRKFLKVWGQVGSDYLTKNTISTDDLIKKGGVLMNKINILALLKFAGKPLEEDRVHEYVQVINIIHPY